MSKAQVRDFLADRREITIGEEGDPDPVIVVYRPGRINAEYTKRIADLASERADIHKVAVFTVCTVVSDWNLTGPLVIDRPVLDSKGKPIRDAYGVDAYESIEIVKAGEPIPVKSDVVKYLNTAMLTRITEEIREDMAPDPKSES